MRSLMRLLLVGSLLLPAGCESGGHFTVLGYSTKPNYDENIRTVYVPIFKSQGLAAGPARMLEFRLTEAVIKRIEQVTPYKVTHDRTTADTELLGTIVSLNKGTVNRNQLNEVRELETNLAVELVWRDLRSGEILSQPRGGPLTPTVPFDPNLPPPIEPEQKVKPVLIMAQGRMIPELGESFSTALQMNVNNLAWRIVSMMEKDWRISNCDCAPAADAALAPAPGPAPVMAPIPNPAASGTLGMP